MEINKKQKILIGIILVSVLTVTVVYAQSVYFVVTLNATIHAPPVLTVVSVVSSGIKNGISSCLTIPASSDGSSIVSISCALDAAKGNSGMIIVTLHSTSILTVTVSATGSSADFTITNPTSQSVSTTDIAFDIGLIVSATAPDASTALSISVSA